MLPAHAWWSNDTTGSWCSQFGQDASIVHLFEGIPGPRFFVDLAANHAVFLSNTRTLERDVPRAGRLYDRAKHAKQEGPALPNGERERLDPGTTISTVSWCLLGTEKAPKDPQRA